MMQTEKNVQVTVGAERPTPERPKIKPRRVIFGGMFILSIIFIMISVSFSWFVSSNGKANVNGLDVNVVEINNLTFDDNGNQTLIINFENTELNSISGDGKSFYIAKFQEDAPISSNGEYTIYGPKFTGYETLSSEKLSEMALVYDFSLGINGKVNLHLGEGSFVESAENSPEYVEGAARVAILKLNQDSGEYEVKCIWVPNVAVNADGSDVIDNKVSFVQSTEVDGEIKTDVKDVITTIESEQGSYTSNDVIYAWGPLDEDNRISLGEHEDRCYYRFVIWLEGTDREATDAIMGEAIKARLQFVPTDIVTNSTGQE